MKIHSIQIYFFLWCDICHGCYFSMHLRQFCGPVITPTSGCFILCRSLESKIIGHSCSRLKTSMRIPCFFYSGLCLLEDRKAGACSEIVLSCLWSNELIPLFFKLSAVNRHGSYFQYRYLYILQIHHMISHLSLELFSIYLTNHIPGAC